MNPFLLLIKQMQQRALSTWLTLLSVLLGTALAVAIMICQREGRALFAQSDFGFDVVVGAKGSPLQLVLNTVYHMDKSPGNIPYSLYEDMLGAQEKAASAREAARVLGTAAPATTAAGSAAEESGPWFRYAGMAVPYAVGDSYKSHRLVGTLPKLFGLEDDGVTPRARVFEYRQGHRYEFAAGRCFHALHFEAVVGSQAAAETGLKIGDQFHATHGMPNLGETPDIHAEIWTVVGILKPTGTANDRVIFLPLVSLYAISEHEQAMARDFGIRTATAPAPQVEEPKHYELTKDGYIILHLPKKEWELSAILVKGRGDPGYAAALQIQDVISRGQAAMAVFPAEVMRQFFDTFLAGLTRLLIAICALVTVVAGIGILVSIYNSVTSRKREIAILRASAPPADAS